MESIIAERIWKGRQDLNVQVIGILASQRVKLEIKRDAYEFQSYGRASVFSPTNLEWNIVYTIPGEALVCYESADPHRRSEPQLSWFAPDLQELEDVTREILQPDWAKIQR